MAASEFGIWKRRLLRHDVALLPVPDFSTAVGSNPGKRLLKIERRLQHRDASQDDWHDLDEAVLDLYELDDADRVVVRDGLFRASWQWKAGREQSVANAAVQGDLTDYAEVFLGVINNWLSVRKARHMRAEILTCRPRQPCGWCVSFLREARVSRVLVVAPNGNLNAILARIGKRLNVKLATALSAEARASHSWSPCRVVIIKPGARRFWMGVNALEDADADCCGKLHESPV